MFRVIISKFLIMIMGSRPYYWLLRSVIPYIRFTTYYTSFTGIQYHIGYTFLEPGDIILTIDHKKLTTLLIPGVMTHAALCVSKNKIWEVSEMTHTDYTKSTFFDVCKQADRVVILRCRDWKGYYTGAVIDKCMSMVDAKYDVAFDLGIEALYCSELVYQSDYERRLDVDLSDLAGVGREYISPDDLYAAKNCDIIWDSDDFRGVIK